VAAAEDWENSEQVEQEGDHRAGIVSGLELRDQPLVHWPSFGEGQVSGGHAGDESLELGVDERAPLQTPQTLQTG